MAVLTIHVCDTPRGSWLEVRGERLEGIEAVSVTTVDGETSGAAIVTNGRVRVVDDRRRSGADDAGDP